MTSPGKILVIQLRRVGDAVLTLPVISILRRSFPSCKIDFLVEKPADQLIALNSDLDETLVYDKTNPISWIKYIRNQKYDWVLDFHSNGRTLILTFFSGAAVRAGFKGPITRRLVYNKQAATTDQKYLVEQKLELLKSLGLEVQGWSWNIKIPNQEIGWADSFLRGAGLNNRSRKLVGIAPATRRATRAWIPERFAELANYLLNQNHDILFLWGPGEKPIVEKIVQKVQNTNGKVIIPPQTSLIQLSALIQKCSFIVAVDNGPKNIAVALGVPTLTIYGPTNPLSFNPHNDPAHLIVRDDKLFCIGCGLNSCPYHHECMENIGSKTVIEKIKSLLTESPALSGVGR